MPSNFQELVESLDGLIRNGQGDLARNRLLKLNHLELPREFQSRLASMARRTGLDELCVRILNPMVFPPKGAPSIATEAEKAEYAAGLVKLGAISEGMHLLETLDAVKNPQIYLYLGLALMAQWKYGRSIPFFEKGNANENLTDYQRLVCRVNLAASLVHEQRVSQATAILEQLKAETAEKYPVLYGNILMYWAELKIITLDIEGARRLLEEAQRVLLNVAGKDNLFVRKWKAVADLFSLKANPESIRAISQIQEEARNLEHWETVRDCDFYKAISTRDKAAAIRLYFGTPFEHYRERLLRDWNTPLDIPSVYTWTLGGRKKTVPLELIQGEKAPRGGKLKVGQTKHRLLCLLASDHYRPFRIVALFGSLFPEEHYNPSTSPMKVHMAIHRLKNWFAENHVPLTITEKSTKYELAASTPCALSIPGKERLATDKVEYSLNKLRKAFPAGFSISEAATALGTSPDSALRILKKAIEHGSIARTGRLQFTRYKFSSVQPTKKAA